MKHLQTVSTGRKALEFLTPGANLAVYGISSKGLFLDTDKDWIIFLSRESFRGPLTINLAGNLSLMDHFRQGDPILVDGNHLVFPRKGTSIQLTGADVWDPPSAPDPVSAASPEKIASILSTFKDPLLEAILEPPSHSTQVVNRIDRRILDLVQAIQGGTDDQILEIAAALLGMGAGLTPEGDDFLIGLCLSKARMSSPITWDQVLSDRSTRKTTRLSANLIEVATHGWADERLVTAHDTLFQGTEEAATAVNNLLGWGNTSGRMALAGITAGIVYFLREQD
ncbi:MAG: DUF2877 domain-containing protein [Anaerolineales bacterium]|jgi:hypothetical protein